MLASTKAHRMEVWMLVTDEGRKRLAKLMVIQDMSHRDLADAAGLASHSYIGRIVRGQVRTLKPETAARIAVALGVGMDDIFVPRASSDAVRPVQRGKTGRAA